MEKPIRIVYKGRESKKEIEKSVFITHSARVTSEQEAKSFIAEIRSKNPFATHVCYAYIADKLGNLQRFSDDGEPQGTAGVPMLEVLKAKQLRETAVAVVRYFGGIKLGAGGLVRAYSSAVAENLDGADIRALEMCSNYQAIVEYTGIDGAQKYIASKNCQLLNSDYGEKVCFTVAVKSKDGESFCSDFIDFMQGKVVVERIGEEYYAPFEEE